MLAKLIIDNLKKEIKKPGYYDMMKGIQEQIDDERDSFKTPPGDHSETLQKS